jgi:hypothetical protein
MDATVSNLAEKIVTSKKSLDGLFDAINFENAKSLDDIKVLNNYIDSTFGDFQRYYYALNVQAGGFNIFRNLDIFRITYFGI